MPLKDKEEYKAYMRDYMKKKHREGISKKSDPDDFAGSKSMIDTNDPTTKEFIKMGKEAMKDPVTGESDPVIDRILKLAPLGIQLIKGFTEAMANAQQNQVFQMQQQQQQAVQQPQMAQAPEGWLSMSPVQRVAKKYSNPDWYNAGQAYEEGKVNNPNPTVQQIEYQPPISRIPQQQQQQPPQEKNLAQIQNKHPEPPLVDDIERHDPNFGKTDKSKTEEKEDVKMEDPKPEQQPNQADQIVSALHADNKKYLDMGIKFLTEMSLDEFKGHVKDIDKLIKKFKPMAWLIPVHLKEMLQNTPTDELVKVFKDNDKVKYNWCVRAKKLKRLKELFESLKKEL